MAVLRKSYGRGYDMNNNPGNVSQSVILWKLSTH